MKSKPFFYNEIYYNQIILVLTLFLMFFCDLKSCFAFNFEISKQFQMKKFLMFLRRLTVGSQTFCNLFFPNPMLVHFGLLKL